MRLNFKLEAKASGSRARAGRFQTLHNEVLTPLFMPVGTQAAVKGARVEELDLSGSQILLANTYHLLLRPGAEVFKKIGGIHRFMNWKKSVLTDSGGFQIFSLPNSRRMTEEGATFKSYVDGKSILLSPELSIEMQKAIGSDIMMVLDQCVPSTSDHEASKLAMELTHRWAKRSLDARQDSPQSLFAIVQGACFEDLRKQSAETLTQMPFDGFAIGGLAVGESKAEREDMTELTAQLLPEHLPRYLMGVGTPIDLLEAVHRGVDMFDCILPSALAQQGVAYTSKGRLRLSRSVYKFSEEALDPDCACHTCKNYSRAYLHHLIKVQEVLGWHLIANHNIHFYHKLMRNIRAHILHDTFAIFYQVQREFLVKSDEENPVRIPKPGKSRRVPNFLGEYEVRVSEKGFSNIHHTISGETMHPAANPDDEAKHLYVNQSQLEQRLLDSEGALVLWDVGLGAAHNAMAAIRCVESLHAAGKKTRPLQLVSFENNLDSLRLALMHPWSFPHICHAAPNAVLKEKKWNSDFCTWTLIEGDFMEAIHSAPAPDLIYFDPFSYKTDSKLWTEACFKKIFHHCTEIDTELFTYSASTAVRAALLASGFFVAKGSSTGTKNETTVGLTPKAVLRQKRDLLSQDWLLRWNRSDAKFPSGLNEIDQNLFEKVILNHSQFQPRIP